MNPFSVLDIRKERPKKIRIQKKLNKALKNHTVKENNILKLRKFKSNFRLTPDVCEDTSQFKEFPNNIAIIRSCEKKLMKANPLRIHEDTKSSSFNFTHLPQKRLAYQHLENKPPLGNSLNRNKSIMSQIKQRRRWKLKQLGMPPIQESLGLKQKQNNHTKIGRNFRYQSSIKIKSSIHPKFIDLRSIPQIKSSCANFKPITASSDCGFSISNYQFHTVMPSEFKTRSRSKQDRIKEKCQENLKKAIGRYMRMYSEKSLK
ncbi:unnamed protein product [Moneuplotes crassus]|uniref:Uncharacterized protein n=1 Tax=Euplotes crassus TaxID=5936 RepID=A0AAD1XN30_EUPCR|nr:unnamed protein product [Moneuplotes crassus]